MDELFWGISIAHWLVIVSVVIGFTGLFAYLRDMFQGKTKPNLVTWGLWGAVPMIAFGAALSSHADGWASVRIFMSGFGPLVIFITALFLRKSYWKIGRFDYLCGAFSIVAIISWLVADSPLSAILFAALADLLATVPTLVKAWSYPETETVYSYFVSLVGAIIIIPAIPVWNIENSAFQIYLIFANASLCLVATRIYWGRSVKNASNIAS